MLKFEEVSELKFSTYLDDVKKELKEKAPEWMVNMMSSPMPDKAILQYHLCRWDFTKGKGQEWPINFYEGIFAYEEGLENRRFHILNVSPISEKK